MELTRKEKEVTYEEALAVCVQHYVDRGYSVEHSTNYVTLHGREEVFRIYNIIQEEMEKKKLLAETDPAALSK